MMASHGKPRPRCRDALTRAGPRAEFYGSWVLPKVKDGQRRSNICHGTIWPSTEWYWPNGYGLFMVHDGDINHGWTHSQSKGLVGNKNKQQYGCPHKWSPAPPDFLGLVEGYPYMGACWFATIMMPNNGELAVPSVSDCPMIRQQLRRRRKDACAALCCEDHFGSKKCMGTCTNHEDDSGTTDFYLISRTTLPEWIVNDFYEMAMVHGWQFGGTVLIAGWSTKQRAFALISGCLPMPAWRLLHMGCIRCGRCGLRDLSKYHDRCRGM